MSYPLTCAAGFVNPMRAGKFEVTQIRATVKNPAEAARITFVDDINIVAGDKVGKMYTDSFIQAGCPRVIDTKLDANSGSDIDVVFGESVKFRHGISIVNAENIITGSLCVYVR